MSGERPLDLEYVAARRVLLEALGTHRKAVVLVGAQAIYLHIGEGDLAVSPYTTDGDLATDPRPLDDAPALTGAPEAAGFELTIPRHLELEGCSSRLPGSGTARRPRAMGARLGVHEVDEQQNIREFGRAVAMPDLLKYR